MPWRGSDVALVLGFGILSIILFLFALSFSLGALGIDVSVGTFVLSVQMLVYAGQAGLAWFVLFRRRRATPEQVGLKWVGAGPLWLMIPGLVGLIFVNIPFAILSNLLFDEVTSPREQLLGSGESLPLGRFVPLFILVAIVAPVVEEFVYRGMFFRLLRSRRSFWAAASISALVFSISHAIPSLVLSLFVLGLILAWVVERYDSIYPAMALHASNNALAVILLYFFLK